MNKTNTYKRLSLFLLVCAMGTGRLWAELVIGSHLAVSNPTPSYKAYMGSAVVAAENGAMAAYALQDENQSNQAGMVYVFDGDGIYQTNYFISDGQPGDKFGAAIASCPWGGWLAGSPGRNGNFSDEGMVYYITPDNGEWLTVSNPVPALGARMGSALVCGKTNFYAGCPGADKVFGFDTNGNCQVTIAPTNLVGVDDFGYALAVLDNGWLAVGSPYDFAVTSGAGRVHLYDADGMYRNSVTSVCPQVNGRFGWALEAVPGGVAVGAPYEQDGCVYIVGYDGQVKTVIGNPYPARSALFGYSLAWLASGYLAIGVPTHDGGSPNTGAVGLFYLGGVHALTVTNPMTGWDEWFGRSLDAKGSELVVGTPYCRSSLDGTPYHKAGFLHHYVITNAHAYYLNDGSLLNDTWCVAPGSQTNSGTSPSQPMCDLRAMLYACDLEPGDTVYVDTGSYLLTNEVRFIFNDSGSSEAAVECRGSPAGSIFVGDGLHVTNLFSIYCYYLTLSDLQLSNALQAGVYVDYQSCFIGMSNLTVQQAVHGLDLNGYDMTAAYSRCQQCENGVYMSSARYLTLDHMLLTENVNGLQQNMNCEPDIHVRFCTIASNSGHAVKTHHLANELHLEHCILEAQGGGQRCIDSFRPWYTPSGQLRHFNYSGDNNLFAPFDGADVAYFYFDDKTFPQSHTYHALSNWQAAVSSDGESLEAQPLFVGVGDYHLRSSATSGTYVQVSGRWQAFPGQDSPGIDIGGTDDEMLGQEPAWHGEWLNAGRYGGTREASRSADRDADGLGNTFETYRLGTSASLADTDGDGCCDRTEWCAGTSPLDHGAVFAAEVMSTQSNRQEIVLCWPSATGRQYSVEYSPAPGASFATVQTVPAMPPLNVSTVCVDGIQSGCYRVSAEWLE